MHTIELIEKVIPKLNHIKFNREAAKKFADSVTENDIAEGKISLASYDWSLEEKMLILFYFNSMNFCFWAGKDEKKWTVEINGEPLDGSFALYRILEENGKNNNVFLNPSSIASLSFDEFKEIFKGRPEIPLIESRFNNLITTANVLLEKYNGSVMTLIENNEYNTKKILNKIESDFPSYEDTQKYKGHEIRFLKRAQLQVKMMNDELEKIGKPLKNLNHLTAIADYKVPQLIRYHGVSEYSDELAELVDNYEILEKDSDYEIEIRITTLWGVELIRRELVKRFPDITNADIDNLLWVSSQKIRDDIKPYHRTLTTGY